MEAWGGVRVNRLNYQPAPAKEGEILLNRLESNKRRRSMRERSNLDSTAASQHRKKKKKYSTITYVCTRFIALISAILI